MSEVTAQNVDQLVYPSNDVSKKLLELQSKYSAIEDGLNIVKKSFDKDNIPLSDMLKLIR